MVTFVTTVSAVRKEAVLFSPPVDTLIYQRLHGFAQILLLERKHLEFTFSPVLEQITSNIRVQLILISFLKKYDVLQASINLGDWDCTSAPRRSPASFV